MLALIENRIHEEVLYREALALGLDKDDTIVRRRMAQKMEFLSEDVSAAREPTTEELKAWFAKNAKLFAQPARASRSGTLYFSPDRRGPHARRTPRRRCAKLAGKPADWPGAAALGDPFMFQDYYADRTPEQIAKDFGPPFARALFEQKPGAWTGPIESGYGWHLVFVDSLTPARGLRLRGSRAGRQDGVARGAKGRGLGQGLQDDAGEVRAPPARAAGGGAGADAGSRAMSARRRQPHRFRVRLRRGAPGDRTAGSRASSGRRLPGRAQSEHGVDRNDGGPRARAPRRVGEELVRQPERGAHTDLRRRRASRPGPGQLRP